MDCAGITHLTFDCYGTLVDWEAGILDALVPLSRRRVPPPTPEELLQSFVRHEAQLETGDWQPYRAVLIATLNEMARDLGLALSAGEERTLAESLPDWPPFADTVPALRLLKQRFKLAIVSNTDDDLFAGTARRLEVPFDEVVTAGQVRSYKPREAHFVEVLRRLRVPVGRVLHVAQSLYHDHVPAKRLGFRTAQVRRPSRLTATGLAPAAPARPDVVASSLAELAELLGG
jgi:2-haloacid dehalogenase